MKTYPESRLTDLLIEFDEMGFCPTTVCPNPEQTAIEWKEQVVKEIQKLQAENAELRERLDKAIEPPVKIGDKKYMPDCYGTMVLEETVIGVRLSYDNICGVCVDCVETRTQRGAVERFTYPQWQTLLHDTREAAEARLS